MVCVSVVSEGMTMSVYTNAATLTLKNRGGTFTLRGVEVPTHELYGYLVGGVVPTSIVAETDAAYLAECLARFAAQHYRAIGHISGYLGTWCHEGNVYIDAVQFVGNRTAALELARERGELAIWDCRSGNEVNAEDE